MLVWFHLIASTHGSWLPGDPRGFRTQHHKEHVEGDYQHPPPKGMYDDRHAVAKHLRRWDAVVLPPEMRSVVGIALREQFRMDGGRVLIVGVSGQHAHVQVQMEDCDALERLGHAKLHAWFAAREHGWKQKLWGKRGKVVRIRDRRHQEKVYFYILNHRSEGAWVWSELEERRTEGA